MLRTSTGFRKINAFLPLCIFVTFSTFVNTQGPCKINEIWTNCLQNHCKARTCDEMGYLKKCSKSKPTECVGGCICDKTYLRNNKNQCVPIGHCPSCAGDFNATSGSGTHCGNLCSNYNQIYVFCLEKPIEHACECKSGYVFNDRIGKCVRPEDCPKPCKGDHYAEEKFCAAPNEPTCLKPHVAKSNDCRPVGSCGCIFPYVLHKYGGKCVRYDTCPGGFLLEDFFPTEAPTTFKIHDILEPVLTSGLTAPDVAALLKVDTRVVRGKDWNGGNEDGGPGSQGTVISAPQDGFVRVEWDNENINSYRMGADRKYELDLAVHDIEPTTTKPQPESKETVPYPVTVSRPTTSTTAKPQIPKSDLINDKLASLLTLDARVVRGKDWTFGDEDGGKGSQGTVIGPLQDGIVRVEWDTGTVNTYQMGKNGKYELALADHS